ncbi:MAG: hypothetical protein MJ252_11085, partial [archaeon]|nr:hypothetical protein [archaeon]
MQPRQWRKKPTEELIKLMEDSIDLKLYLIQEKGPLSLTFQDEDGDKFHISIGSDISCSCGGGKTEHCIHTIYALNRIYKLPFSDQLILQLHFTDSDLTRLLEMKNKPSVSFKNTLKNKKKIHKSKIKESQLDSKQMSLLEDIVCPICQEDLYKSEGVYFCSNSCGHNFHVSCLKVFIKHKKENSSPITCPMCRAHWDESEFDNIIVKTACVKCTKAHKGIDCKNCGRSNIKFERFHCLICENYDLCLECFCEGIHRENEHPFIVRKTNDDKWHGCEFKDENYEEEEDFKKYSTKIINKNERYIL